jgi:glycosyltransferase involved in cell wall biosynthesis
MVLVSVLMASFNHERYISEAIESVLKQSFSDLELIIVDDCSTDGSKQLILDYQAKDNRVHAFFHKENMGIAKTVNHALDVAKGRFISFIGSDDLWVPKKLELQLEVLRKNEDMLVWSEGDIIDAEGNEVGKNFSELNQRSNKPVNGRIYRELIHENYIFGQSLIFKRDFCQDLRFNATLRYLSDYQFMVDMGYLHDFLFVPESLAKYRIHGKNTICRDRNGWLLDRILIRRYFLVQYGKYLSRRQRGNLFLRIGEAYRDLGDEDTAKACFLKAMRTDFFSAELLLYLSHIISAPHGILQKILFISYSIVSKTLSIFH